MRIYRELILSQEKFIPACEWRVRGCESCVHKYQRVIRKGERMIEEANRKMFPLPLQRMQLFGEPLLRIGLGIVHLGLPGASAKWSQNVFDGGLRGMQHIIIS